MTTMAEQKKTVVCYWERRRIIYNLLLVPPTLLGWFMGGAVSASVGDPERISLVALVTLFVACVLAANICFSFAYVFEFLCMAEADSTFWKQRGRSLVFAIGCIGAIALAWLGGIQISAIQYSGFP